MNFRFFVLFAILLCAVCTCALADFSVPANTTTIEEEAFMNNSSMSSVTLPDGLLRIESKAFYHCGLYEINLPGTLNYVANDAFSGNDGMVVKSAYGSMAYNWAKQKGFFTVSGGCDVRRISINQGENGKLPLTINCENGIIESIYFNFDYDTCTWWLNDFEEGSSYTGNVDLPQEVFSSIGEFPLGIGFFYRANGNDNSIFYWLDSLLLIITESNQSDPLTIVINEEEEDEWWVGDSISTTLKQFVTVTPSSVSLSSLNYYSTNESVVSVSVSSSIIVINMVGVGEADVVVEAANGVRDTWHAKVINPNPALTITANPISQTVNDGDSVTFSVTASGGMGSYTYQWYRASSSTETGTKVSTSQNYTFTASSTYDGYYYYCVITSSGETVTSSRAKLTVNDDEPVTSIVINEEEEDEWWVGDSITSILKRFVTVTPSSVSLRSLNYYSTNESVVTVSVTSDIIEIHMVGIGEADIVAEASNGVRDTMHIKVVPSDPALTIITHPVPITVNEGENAVFSVTAYGGDGSYSYKWYRASSLTDSGKRVGGISQTLTIGVDAEDDGYYYYCVVTSGNKSVTSDRAKLTVKPSDGTFIVEKGSATIIANGDTSGSFACGSDAGEGDVATFTVTSDYTWTVTASDTSWMTVKKTNSTTAVVTIGTVHDGASYSSTLTFTVNGRNYSVFVTLNKNKGTFIVEKGSATIIANGDTSGSFACGFDAGQGDIATFTITSDYTWTVTASNTSWMTVKKTNSSTAVVTIGSVEDGKNYSSILTFTSNSKTYKLTITLNKTAPSVTFNGAFINKTKTLTLGQSWIVEGTISVNNSTLGRVTINSDDGAGFSLTEDFRDTGYNSTHLQNWAAYTIDTTKAPFNTVGTYTVNLWAKDVNGVGGNGVLDTMTLIIQEVSAPVVIHPSADLSSKLDTLKTVFPAGKYWTWGNDSDTTGYEIKTLSYNGQNATFRLWSSPVGCSSKSQPACQRFVKFKDNSYGGIASNASNTNYKTSYGLQCYGFANVISWGLTGNVASQVGNITYATDDNRQSLVNNLVPGDVLQLRAHPDSGNGHTVVVIDTTVTSIKVVDCNWDHNCGIRWNGSFDRSVLSGTSGNFLYWVIKYESYE